jgi:sulfotransferase family protein
MTRSGEPGSLASGGAVELGCAVGPEGPVGPGSAAESSGGSPVAPRAGGRVPDFFIVGHPKSGTTALYEMLRRHPQIYMPDLKEPRFFASDLRVRFQRRAPDPSSPSTLPQTYEEYLALFDAARLDQRVGEASPLYLMSRAAPELIARVQPAARIVAILREPVSFLRSLQLELVQNHIESERDFRRAMAKERLEALGEGTPDYAPPIRRYSDRVRYVEQLRRYHAVFAREQVLVLVYDDFRADNEATVRRVLRFLEVDDGVALHAVEANPTVHVRSVRLDRFVRLLYAGDGLSRVVRRTIKALTPRRWHGERFQAVRRRLIYGAPRPPDEALTLELRSRFKSEVVALSEYLGRDLVSEWGYDLVD